MLAPPVPGGRLRFFPSLIFSWVFLLGLPQYVTPFATVDMVRMAYTFSCDVEVGFRAAVCALGVLVFI